MTYSNKEVCPKIAKTSFINISLHVRLVNCMIFRALGLFRRFLGWNPIRKMRFGSVDGQVDALFRLMNSGD